MTAVLRRPWDPRILPIELDVITAFETYFEGLMPVPKHELLTKFRLKPAGPERFEYSSRQIVLPMSDGLGRMRGLQCIDPHGRRDYWPESQIAGNAFLIDDFDLKKPIYLCTCYECALTLRKVKKLQAIAVFENWNLEVDADVYSRFDPAINIVGNWRGSRAYELAVKAHRKYDSELLMPPRPYLTMGDFYRMKQSF